MNAMILRFAAYCILLSLFAINSRAAAPVVVSVTPAIGATGVATTSSLVFKFDQDMDTTVTAIQSGPGYAGAFSLTATGFNQTLVGAWGADQRTLTITPNVQFPFGTFTWTLNPSGGFAVARLKNKSGEEVASVSGTFTTGAAPAAPHLTSSTPGNNAQSVATNTVVQFRFDLAMKQLTSAELGGTPAGNGGAILWAGIDAAKFNYTWSVDGRTLNCVYVGGFPKDAIVAWMLNPSTAVVKFESTTAIALASENYKGSFFTAGPETGCSFGSYPANWGNFSINKFYNYVQNSAADPLPNGNGAFAFTAAAQGSLTSAVTAVSIVFPDATTTNLFVFNGTASAYLPTTNRDTLNTKFPAGAYTMRLTQNNQPLHEIAMTMTADSGVIPKLLNFDEAQTIDPATDFTLRWNPLPNPTGSNYLSVILVDDKGRTVFRAPNPCVPRPLSPTDTSVVVPGHLLLTNTTYTGILQFGNMFYFDTNAIPSMAGSGNMGALTTFTAKTTGGGVSIQAPTIGNFVLLPNGNPQFEVAGTVSQIYVIERTPILLPPNWSQAGSVTIQAGGNATFEDTQPNKTYPLFYRAVGQ
jgi:hypothetical protein